jgi:hypothetical protein
VHRPDRSVRSVAALEIPWAFLKHVVGHFGPGRQRPAERRDPLDVPEHFHFGLPELFALLKILTRLVREARVAKQASGFFAINVFRPAGDRL